MISLSANWFVDIIFETVIFSFNIFVNLLFVFWYIPKSAYIWQRETRIFFHFQVLRHHMYDVYDNEFTIEYGNPILNLWISKYWKLTDFARAQL